MSIRGGHTTIAPGASATGATAASAPLRPKGGEAALRGNVASGKHPQPSFLTEQKSDGVFRTLFEWFLPLQKVKCIR
jgi:hypothetical protein